MPGMMISVVTVCRNAETTIAETIASVRRQTWPRYEHLICDGRSTDRTVEVIGRHAHERMRWTSEPDQGQYDALNKGVAQARGDVVGLIHGDDLLGSDDALAHVGAAFERDPQLEVVYGDLVQFRDAPSGRRATRVWHTGTYSPRKWRWGWHPPHPTLFIRRGVYEELGGFRTDLKVASDYEFMLRLFEVRGCRSRYLKETLVLQRAGGVSNRDPGAIAFANRECLESWRMNGLRAPWYFVPAKLARKVLQVQVRPVRVPALAP